MATKSEVLSKIEDGEARTKARAALEELLEEAREAGHNESGHGQRKEIERLKGEVEAAKTALAAAQDKAKAEADELRAKLAQTPAEAERLKTLESDLKARDEELAKLRPIVQEAEDAKLYRAIGAAAGLKHPDLIGPALAKRLGVAFGKDGKLSEEHTKALAAWAADPANKDLVTPPAATESGQKTETPTLAPPPKVPTTSPLGGPAFIPRPTLTPAAQAYIDRQPPGPARDAALAAYAPK